jgi:hypothetical protein
MIDCAQHRQREADFHCPRCQEGFCRECIKIQPYGNTQLRLCPVCANPVTDLAPFMPLAPFWRRPGGLIAFPFTRGAWRYFLYWPLPAILMRMVAMLGLPEISYGMFAGQSLLIFTIYFGMLFLLFTKLVAWGERGKIEMPTALEFGGFSDSLFTPFLNFMGGFISVFFPLMSLPIVMWFVVLADYTKFGPAMVHPVTIAIAILLALAGIILLPMSFLVAGATSNMRLLQNPLFLLQEALKIKKEYALSLVFFYVPLALYFVIRALMDAYLWRISLLPAVLYYLIDTDLHLYLFLYLGHLLGVLGYQARFKLKWWPETEAEPVFWVGGQRVMLSWKYETPPEGEPVPRRVRPEDRHPARAEVASAPLDLERERALQAQVTEGMYLMDHGTPELARPKFKAVLAERADHFGALRGLVMAAFRLEDYDTVREYGRVVAEELGKQYAFEALWGMYQDYRQAIPDFTLAPPELIKLSDWLLQQQNHLDAARVLRELAVVYQAHPLAPEALYQCAQILMEQGGKPDTARSLLAALIKRYPDSEYAAKAQHRLAQISGDLAPGAEPDKRL